MDRLIINDGVPKIVDLGFHAFDDFFKMAAEIGFMKEADRRGIDPVVLFIPDRDRASAVAWQMLRASFPNAALVPVANEHVLWGRTAEGFRGCAAVQDRGAARVPQIDHRPAEFLIHALSARQQGPVVGTASVGAQQLHPTPASAKWN